MASPPHKVELDAISEILRQAALAAGDIALRDFRAGGPTAAKISTKAGGSPVTDADLAVDAFLKEHLRDRLPNAAWLSEESLDSPLRLNAEDLLIVDPIDGTRGYIAGDARWAISIALMRQGQGLVGIVYAPALGQIWSAALGQGATLNGSPLGRSTRGALHGAAIGGPKPMIAALANAAKVEFVAAPRNPSLALRLVSVASGALDIGLAGPNSNDWDIAGADIILCESGARLVELGAPPIRYNLPQTKRGALLAAPLSLMPEALAAAQYSRGHAA